MKSLLTRNFLLFFPPTEGHSIFQPCYQANRHCYTWSEQLDGLGTTECSQHAAFTKQYSILHCYKNVKIMHNECYSFYNSMVLKHYTLACMLTNTV